MYTLNWQPPYDWSWMLGFLAARAVSGVETVADSYYARSLAVGEYRGVVTAIPDIARHTLHINLSAGLEPVAAECMAKMSRLLDLQCNPQIVNGALGKLGAARPGLRLPGCVDAFEQGVRAILGQLVSVAMAAKLTARVAQLYGERLDDFPEYICFPTPQRLAAADPQALKALGMPLKRAEALIHLANAALEGTLPMTIPGDVEQAMKTLQTFPGIGRWTANYFALRGWQAKDIFVENSDTEFFLVERLERSADIRRKFTVITCTSPFIGLLVDDGCQSGCRESKPIVYIFSRKSCQPRIARRVGKVIQIGIHRVDTSVRRKRKRQIIQ